MAKKKTKKEGKIINSPKEAPVDVTAVKDSEAWEMKTVAAESETKLEQDKGEGSAIKIFFFEYAANAEAFKRHQPTAQELFNQHLKEIEVRLWTEGWKIYTDVEPRLTFNKSKTRYRFIVAAVLARGHILEEQPKTIEEIIYERPLHR